MNSFVHQYDTLFLFLCPYYPLVLDGILEEVISLVKYGNFSYVDCLMFTYFERQILLKKLKDILEKENATATQELSLEDAIEGGFITKVG